MPSRPQRLVMAGSVIADIMLSVPSPPGPGGDALARHSSVLAGGGFNVLTAASRQGLPGAYAGLSGNGPFGAIVREALADESIAALLPPREGGDTGFVIVFVDDTGERTFATSPGIESELDAAALATVAIKPDDAVCLSGYDLLYPTGGEKAAWFAALPEGVLTCFDPGPLVGEIPVGPLRQVIGRVDWLTLNDREATALAARPDVAGSDPERLTHQFILREGSRGATVHREGEPSRHLDAPSVEPLDTTGAGDVHVGCFLAALGRGLDPVEACRAANAAAADSTTRFGGASGPVAVPL